MITYLYYKFVRYVGEGAGGCKQANRRLQQISNLRNETVSVSTGFKGF